jgi:hypothetical protein
VAAAPLPLPSVYISEILAEDDAGSKDEDGDRPGWIELSNPTANPVNLAGWHLTDDRARLTKWTFPGVVLLPDKSLIVFASGKNRTTNLLQLHTNFRLEPTGAYLALVDRGTNVASEFAPKYPALLPGISFGSARGEPSARGPFLRPTPGRPNASNGAGFAAEVMFSVPTGTFLTPFRLELSTGGANPGSVVIRYTRDGSLPTQASAVYESPLEITNTTHLRVRTYEEGRLPGQPASAVYLRLDPAVVQFTSTLPVLVFDSFGRNLPVSTRATFAHLSVFAPVDGQTALTNRPVLTTRTAQRVRGSTSSGMPQPGYAIEFVDEFNGERTRPFLGMPSDSDWILYAPNAYDPVLIHNPFMHQLSRDLGRYSPRTRFVEVFVVTGAGRVRAHHYQGVYVLEEKIKIGPNRVRIDRLEAGDLKPPAVTGGYLMKFDRLGPDESGAHFVGDRPLAYVEPREAIMLLPQRAAQRRYLAGYIEAFERALDGPNWKDPRQGYPAYLDIDAAIDFHVLELLSGNVDALVLSTYLYKPRQGRLTFGPHWDFDRALGSTDGRDEDPRNWNTGPFFHGPWWDRLFTDPDFWQRWVDRWQELRQSHLALTNLNRLIDVLAGEVREAQPRQYQRWAFQPRGGSYQAELNHMKQWLSNRVDFIDGQLVPRPTVHRETNQAMLVTFVPPPTATVYYTLDGSDPRRPQGGLSTNALEYSVPLKLPSTGSIVARARNPAQRQTGGPPRSTPWSGRVILQAPEAPTSRQQ